METPSALQQAFITVYAEKRWGNRPGASPANTIEYRAFIERFIQANAVRSVTDLGCGDWQHSHLIDWSQVEYIGLDAVPEIIERNRSRFTLPNLKFAVSTLVDDLPGGDLLVSKNVLQHLPNQTIVEYLAAIHTKYRFAILTNATEPKDFANREIVVGDFRPLRLQDAPFNTPGAVVFTFFTEEEGLIRKNASFLMSGRRT
jgi:SAM-dependent methyltransferase